MAARISLLVAVALLSSAVPAASVTCEGSAGPIWGNNNSFCCGEPGVQIICQNGSRCMRPIGSTFPVCLAPAPPLTAAVNRSRAVICNPDGRTLYGLPGSKCCGEGDTTILCGKGYDCKITEDDRNLCLLSKNESDDYGNESEPEDTASVQMVVVGATEAEVPMKEAATTSEEALAGSAQIAVALGAAVVCSLFLVGVCAAMRGREARSRRAQDGDEESARLAQPATQ